MSDSNTNPANDFADLLLDKVTNDLGISGKDNDPIGEFSHPAFGNLGYIKILDGGAHKEVLKVIRLRLNFAPVGMEANAVHVITRPDSLVPHAILEGIYHDPTVDTPFRPAHDGPGQFGCFANCVSRVDPGVNLKYMQHVYLPLEDAYKSVAEDEEIRLAPLPRIQLAAMQPWAIPATAPDHKKEVVQKAISTYLQRTLDIIAEGLPAGLVSAEEAARSASRDAVNRVTYLHPEVDHIWGQFDKLLGEDVSKRLFDILTSQEVETSF